MDLNVSACAPYPLRRSHPLHHFSVLAIIRSGTVCSAFSSKPRNGSLVVLLLILGVKDMHRADVLQKLQRYCPKSEQERVQQERMITFVNDNPDCFSRNQLPGHLTGSAWLLHPSGDKVLLTLHKKLNQWLQLGGHADGDPNLLSVALKEAHEESGIDSIDVVCEDIFDLDVHFIPERKNEPGHYHYDIRFLLQAQHAHFTVSEESVDLGWFTFDEILDSDFLVDASVRRMAEKTRFS